jgi:hypothetical protein
VACKDKQLIQLWDLALLRQPPRRDIGLDWDHPPLEPAVAPLSLPIKVVRQ